LATTHGNCWATKLDIPPAYWGAHPRYQWVGAISGADLVVEGILLATYLPKSVPLDALDSQPRQEVLCEASAVLGGKIVGILQEAKKARWMMRELTPKVASSSISILDGALTAIE